MVGRYARRVAAALTLLCLFNAPGALAAPAGDNPTRSSFVEKLKRAVRLLEDIRVIWPIP